ncbi:hypothetical protein WCT97_22045, partial [Pectobacterium versatile]|uniref:hypothetical protein n=1 Tax=Pectobacterium versatile TaxID=2488639 RepID=UPI003018757E
MQSNFHTLVLNVSLPQPTLPSSCSLFLVIELYLRVQQPKVGVKVVAQKVKNENFPFILMSMNLFI